MVNLTVYASAGDFDLTAYLALDTVVRRRVVSGTNFFFTGTDVYGATAYAHRTDAAGWSGKLFLGATVFDGQGDVGFAPQALMAGMIGGTPVDRYLDVIAERGFTAEQVQKRLLSGNDHLTGSVHDDVLFGGAGRDVIDGGPGGDDLDGGDGNDVIFTGSDAQINYYGSETTGGKGDDVIVVGENYSGRVYGGRGDDTFFVGHDSTSGDRSPNEFFGSDYHEFDDYRPYHSHDSDTFYLSGSTAESSIEDFRIEDDRIVLDPAFFQSLGGTLSEANVSFEHSGSLPSDSDDYLIIYWSGQYYPYNTSSVWYDPDGSGPAARIPIIQIVSDKELTFANLSLEHLVPPSITAGVLHEPTADAVSAPHPAQWPTDLTHFA